MFLLLMCDTSPLVYLELMSGLFIERLQTPKPRWFSALAAFELVVRLFGLEVGLFGAGPAWAWNMGATRSRDEVL